MFFMLFSLKETDTTSRSKVAPAENSDKAMRTRKDAQNNNSATILIHVVINAVFNDSPVKSSQ